MTFHQVRLHHKPLLGALLLTAMLAACGENDDLQAGQPATGAGKHYVSLTFTMPTQDETSRAVNPTGGERGDGYEQGQDNENTITDAVAFFFQNNGAGVNGDAKTPVQYMFFNSFKQTGYGNGNGIDRTYTSKPIPTDLYGEYNVLVVANPGKDDWWTSTTTLTLGTVRDKVLTQAWAKEGEEYSYFLMSSAKDAAIQISDANNTESTAANTEINVERMAARVDYKKLGSYTCEDPNYTGATVEIKGAILVNNLTDPGSYAMKRVSTASTGGDITYLGDETLGTDNLPNNWVLDPTTGNKSSAKFGVSWTDTEASDPNWWSDLATIGTEITKEQNEKWNILGYTLENITARDETKHDYNTAVVFKAKFHPVGLQNYQDGATFFELNKKIYASMEDMIADFYGKKISDIDAEVTACTSWEDVEDLASDLKGIDPSGYKQWLQGQIDESKTLDDVMKNSLTWTSYMLNECGYSATLENGVYTVKINQGDKITADILAEYGARTYEKATCYYTWWIRHANDGDEDTNGVMEYAIVRNNIYELDVTKISSLGGYIPNEEEKGFIVNVYVKDWTLLEPERIEM